MEIVGRHHDPFTVMEQFTRPIRRRRLLTTVDGRSRRPVLSGGGSRGRLQLDRPAHFPFSAAAGIMLGRYLGLSRRWRGAGGVCVRLFAFSSRARRLPSAHRADAVDPSLPSRAVAVPRPRRPGGGRRAGLSVAGVTLSNFYGGLIAAVVTPVALVAVLVFQVGNGARPLAPARDHGRQPGRYWPAAASRTRWTWRTSVVVERRGASHSPAPTCSDTARSGGAISCRRSSIRCSGAWRARLWNAAGVRARACSNNR